jgi:hypothetical protein
MKTPIRNLQAVKILIILGLAVIFTAGIVYAGQQNEITKKEVLEAQKAWADALVNIGKKYTDRQDYKQAAKDALDELYAYQTGQVLFKPTKASDDKFRMTREGAISYMVGHNKNFPEDKGFALQPWTNVRFKNAGLYINGNVAIAMGKYFFTPRKGNIVKVEYTFGYAKNDAGKLKIFLHHSSLPYSKK